MSFVTHFIPPRISDTLCAFLAFVTFFISPQDCTLQGFLACVMFFVPLQDCTLLIFYVLCNIFSTFGDFTLWVFLAFVMFFVPPMDFRSHFTGLFSLCNNFCTPQGFQIFMGIFGLCNVFCTPRDFRSLQVFMAFVIFFINNHLCQGVQKNIT